MQDTVVAATRAQVGVVPGYSANTALVPTHCPDQSIFNRIPNLELTRVSSNGEESTVTAPLDASHTVLWPDVTQLCDFAVCGGPQVNARAESNGKHVLS